MFGNLCPTWVPPFVTSDPNNNAGEQTLDGFQTSTGRSHTFVVPVRNPTGSTQTIDLSAGPAGVVPWTTIVPSSLTLGAGAQQNVMVSVNVPTAIPKSPPGTLISAGVDVLATIGGAYTGAESTLPSCSTREAPGEMGCNAYRIRSDR